MPQLDIQKVGNTLTVEEEKSLLLVVTIDDPESITTEVLVDDLRMTNFPIEQPATTPAFTEYFQVWFLENVPVGPHTIVCAPEDHEVYLALYKDASLVDVFTDEASGVETFSVDAPVVAGEPYFELVFRTDEVPPPDRTTPWTGEEKLEQYNTPGYPHPETFPGPFVGGGHLWMPVGVSLLSWDSDDPEHWAFWTLEYAYLFGLWEIWWRDAGPLPWATPFETGDPNKKGGEEGTPKVYESDDPSAWFGIRVLIGPWQATPTCLEFPGLTVFIASPLLVDAEVDAPLPVWTEAGTIELPYADDFASSVYFSPPEAPGIPPFLRVDEGARVVRFEGTYTDDAINPFLRTTERQFYDPADPERSVVSPEGFTIVAKARLSPQNTAQLTRHWFFGAGDSDNYHTFIGGGIQRIPNDPPGAGAYAWFGVQINDVTYMDGQWQKANPGVWFECVVRWDGEILEVTINGDRRTAPMPSPTTGSYANGILVGAPDFAEAENGRFSDQGYLLCYNRYFEDEELADLLECIHTRIPLTDQPPIVHAPEEEALARRARRTQVIG